MAIGLIHSKVCISCRINRHSLPVYSSVILLSQVLLLIHTDIGFMLAKMRDVRKYSAVVTKLFSQEWMVRCLESNIDLIDIIISQQFPKRSYLASLPFYSYTSTSFFHNCHLDCVSNLFIHLSIIISSNIN